MIISVVFDNGIELDIKPEKKYKSKKNIELYRV